MMGLMDNTKRLSMSFLMFKRKKRNKPMNILNIGILLTANLGVMNLIPFPALDGGRLIFLFIEAIRGKRIPPEKEGMVHFAGFALLMILMVVVMYNDIMRIF